MKALKKQLDRLVQEIICIRDHGICARCDCKYEVGGHHLIYKSQSLRLRYDPLNLVSLCYKCHTPFTHGKPKEFLEWSEVKFPGRLDKLKAMDEIVHWNKFDLLEIKEQLERKRDEYLNRSRSIDQR